MGTRVGVFHIYATLPASLCGLFGASAARQPSLTAGKEPPWYLLLEQNAPQDGSVDLWLVVCFWYIHLCPTKRQCDG